MLNTLAIINKLDDINNNSPQDLVAMYQKVFGDVEGEIVLIDLMMRFGEFKPSVNQFEAGNQAVLIYIKNRMLGIMEQPVQQGEIQNEHTDN